LRSFAAVYRLKQHSSGRLVVVDQVRREVVANRGAFQAHQQSENPILTFSSMGTQRKIGFELFVYERSGRPLHSQNDVSAAQGAYTHRFDLGGARRGFGREELFRSARLTSMPPVRRDSRLRRSAHGPAREHPIVRITPHINPSALFGDGGLVTGVEYLSPPEPSGG
jgi:hypothetical protein